MKTSNSRYRKGQRIVQVIYRRILVCLVFALLVMGTSHPGQAKNVALDRPNFPGRSRALTPNSVVQEMLNQVQSSVLYDYVSGLSGKKDVTIGGTSFKLYTRSTGAAAYIEKATQYAYEHFQALGLDVTYHTWSYYGGLRRNVAAEQPGTDPNCLYVLAAHLDDTSPTANTIAPGADDNASGVAGVFMAADILSKYDFTCSLRYVLFSGEEQGFYGSEAYAQDAATNGDPILGVLNLDMIAYNTPGSAATIEMDIRSGPAGNPDRVLSTMVTDVIQAYQLELTAVVYPSNDAGSDQYSFWQAGFPAVLIIEDWEDHTPNYHTLSDDVDSLNLAYFTAYVKAILGAAAHLGKPTVYIPTHRVYFPLVSR